MSNENTNTKKQNEEITAEKIGDTMGKGLAAGLKGAWFGIKKSGEGIAWTVQRTGRIGKSFGTSLAGNLKSDKDSK